VPAPMSLSAFMSANSRKDSDDFIDVAQLIAGENAPQWFARHLQRWSSSVFLDGNVHAIQLGKKDTRTRLKRLSHAVDLADQELHDHVIAEILLEFGPLPDFAGIDVVLEEVRRRADKASSRLDLLGTGLDERLENLSAALKLMVRELRDPALSEFLEDQQIIGPPPPTRQLGALLKEIGRQADAAMSSPYLVSGVGQTKAGRGRALLPSASRPRAFCAAVILEAWAHFHDGEYPRASNHTLLWTAAEEYWRACGGVTNGSGSGSLSAWRPYFKEASEGSLAGVREELRRHMAASAARID
jgi:hypothetical protein